MVGWHHQSTGHELGQTLGDGEGLGSLVCCNSWGCKESDMTWRLNNNKTMLITHHIVIYPFSLLSGNSSMWQCA